MDSGDVDGDDDIDVVSGSSGREQPETDPLPVEGR